MSDHTFVVLREVCLHRANDLQDDSNPAIPAVISALEEAQTEAMAMHLEQPAKPQANMYGPEHQLADCTASPVPAAPQPFTHGMSELVHVGNGLFLEKLCINEEDDGASIEGPSTPDNEEGSKISMPATKRQRVGWSSPSSLASTFARALYII
jgi:hypothetical protein